ncbi:MAG TPA: transporter [Casimicrobiaceae bacterium]|nr:transporter [Casimicrobiaceae bacterium]
MRLFPAVAAIAASCFPGVLYAQFTDPRTYTVGPVGLNDLEFDYTYARANASIDTSVVVGSATLELNKGDLSYTHNFSVLGHFAWVNATVPYASLRGYVAESNISGSTTGPGDSSLELAGILMGGKALSAPELATHEQTTSVGISLTVPVPTGEYNADKVLNVGTHRWSFKPEVGISYPFGPEQKWEVDGYVNALFFTDNTAYHGVEVLRQEPLPGVEGHISYTFTHSLWASLDTRYAFRGETVVDGLAQNNSQEGLIVGAEAHWLPNSRNSLGLVFAKALVHTNAPNYTGVVLKYVYSWGKDYK